MPIRKRLLVIAEKHGGIQQFAAKLDVTSRTLSNWIVGFGAIPEKYWIQLKPYMDGVPMPPQEHEIKAEPPVPVSADIVSAIISELSRRGMLSAPQQKRPARNKSRNDDNALESVLGLIREHGKRISRAELLYRSHLRDREFNRVLAVLAERGHIRIESETIITK
ncbi:hypothetical protein [Victivallis vadensis]|uniref:hypothetical protein n=1 Tax=Victivallis vadensis TaxID=172901 RepID=UPI003CFDA3DF